MKRLIIGLLCLFITIPCYGNYITNSKDLSPSFQSKNISRDISLGGIGVENGLKKNLIFFIDYRASSTKPSQFVGNGMTTFSSVSNVPVFSNGIRITLAGSETLRYKNEGNRAANEETVFIKCTPDRAAAGAFNNVILDSDTKRRFMGLQFNGDQSTYPNATDSAAVVVLFNETYSAFTPAVFSCVYLHATNPAPTTLMYKNGILKGSDTTNGDWVNNAWGEYFYLGCDNNGATQLDGTIQKVAIFNRALSTSEVSIVTNLLNQ